MFPDIPGIRKIPQERGGAVKKTKSEQLFEDYCDHVTIPWTHIEVGASKTPDYSLSVDGQVVIAEVKEVTRNPEEQASDRQIKETRIGKGMRGKPGARVRKKITDSLQQIKGLTKGNRPGILVLAAADSQSFLHLDSHNVMTAMYGSDVVEVAVPKDSTISPYAIGTRFGPNQKMTDDMNTSISAIAVLTQCLSGSLKLVVYRNHYAAVPIEPAAVRRLGAVQRDIDLERRGWVTVE